MAPEELRKAIDTEMKENENFPGDTPVREVIGKSKLMNPTSHALDHEAADILLDMANNGAPVDCGPQ